MMPSVRAQWIDELEARVGGCRVPEWARLLTWDEARELVGEGEFIEIHVDTPLEVCEARDPKGLYKKARAGTLKNFTGIDSEYERPLNAEITINTAEDSVDTLADRIIDKLRAEGRV